MLVAAGYSQNLVFLHKKVKGIKRTMCLCTCVKDGLVKANMEKLTFFALSAPEKLDRIAAYLSERLTRELNRHRYGLATNNVHIDTHTHS